MTKAKSPRRVCILLNRNAGTARGSDLATLKEAVAAPFMARGDAVEVRASPPKRLARETSRLNRERAHDLIVLGGGDGTLSRCARDLAEYPGALAFLPLGTMNLFARALGMPMDAAAAAAAIAEGKERKIDVGQINGMIYLHHASFGLHPSLIRQREAMEHRSRAGKIAAGFRAFWLTVRAPSVLKLNLDVDGEIERRPASAIIVSNNLFGDGHLPYPDAVTEGTLGVYLCHSFEWSSLVRLGADTMLGRVNDNPDIRTMQAPRVRLAPSGRLRGSITASLDGELTRIRLPGEIEILPARLTVVTPQPAD